MAINKSPVSYTHLRLAIFPPMELINQDGEMQTLVQKGENYQYQSEKPLKDGLHSFLFFVPYKSNK